MAQIQKIRYNHDALIDLMIANPELTQKEMAVKLGRSTGWLTQVISSDMFKARLAERRAEIVDPVLTASVEERLDALASRSAQILLDRLDVTPDTETALRALEISTKARGYGARDKGAVTQNNFVVVVPQKAEDSSSWADRHTITIPQEISHGP